LSAQHGIVDGDASARSVFPSWRSVISMSCTASSRCSRLPSLESAERAVALPRDARRPFHRPGHLRRGSLDHLGRELVPLDEAAT
jgi:hypothetical protein